MTVNATLAPSSADTAEAGNGGAPSAGNSAKFDPTEHLDYQPPSKIWTMQELDFPEDQGISPMSVSEPFPLFSKAAVREMRKEILSRPVWENHRFQSKHAQCQLRGYARRHAPFTYGAWHDPRVLGIISKIAGIELVPNMDYEVAHINISGSDVAKLNPFGPDAEQQRPKPAPEDDEPRKDKGAIVGWHQDSYPFVCVTMLSDCTDMVGGETALKTGKGEVVKVRGPQMGSAVVLQGRYIDHQALRTIGGSERISMVTSFRPRSPAIKDDTTLFYVRPISDIHELYSEYSSYRFGILEERFRAARAAMETKLRYGEAFSVAETNAFIDEQIQFLEQMRGEIFEHKGCKVVR